MQTKIAKGITDIYFLSLPLSLYDGQLIVVIAFLVISYHKRENT